MKSFEEIEKDKRIVSIENVCGHLDGTGIIKLPYCGMSTVVFTKDEEGWEHVSVAPLKKNMMPTWDDMRILKEMFWEDDEEVHQIHPKKSEYVNVVSNCLHLWRPSKGWAQFEQGV